MLKREVMVGVVVVSVLDSLIPRVVRNGTGLVEHVMLVEFDLS